MKVFLIIPLPFLLLAAITFNGVSGGSKPPRLWIPANIDEASLSEQQAFGEKAFRAKKYSLALKYCGNAVESDEFETNLYALMCLGWTHEALENFEEALGYWEQIQLVELSVGWGTEASSRHITELKERL